MQEVEERVNERLDVLAEEIRLMADPTDQALKRAHKQAMDICDGLHDLSCQAIEGNDWAMVEALSPIWGGTLSAMCEIGRLRKYYRKQLAH